MKTIVIRTKAQLEAACERLRAQPEFHPGQEARVRGILEAVRRRGDRALVELAWKLDHTRLSPKTLRIPPAQVKAALRKVGRPFLASLKRAKDNIARFHGRQKQASWRAHVRPGVLLGQLVRPLARVGLCVPAGDAPLVSTVLMTAVPAKVAGVRELVMVTPNRGGRGVDARLLAAAAVAGVDEVWQVGGAQAVAALAWGTKTLRPVDKIVGPGSSWVALAQKLAFGTVGVDMIAGPSEIMIVADRFAPASLVAADLLSQAEHAGEESAVLVTPCMDLARKVQDEIRIQARRLPKKRAIEASLGRFGLILVVKDLDMALKLANARAPEHLELMTRGAEGLLPRVMNAGAVFLGADTPEAVGDYLAGPSHVLPTGGTARFCSGLSVESFIKRSSIIRYDRRALEAAREDILRLAGAEGLGAHAQSVLARGGRP